MSYKKPQTPLQHKDGDYFYPLTTIDQIIMEDGITRLNGADLVSVNTDGAPEGETARINADTLGGYPADEYLRKDQFEGEATINYIAPRNLLDNSDFRNPVNQRGQSTYCGAFVYGIDRWETTNTYTTVDISSGVLTLKNSEPTSTGYLLQIIENPKRLLGKTVTMAVKVHNDKVYCMTATFPPTFPSSNTVVGNGIACDGERIGGLLINSNSIWVRIWCKPTETERSFEWAALYEGEYTIDTLPEYQPKGYGAELAECMRYCVQIPLTVEGFVIGYGVASTDTTAYITVDLPVTLQNYTSALPTIMGTFQMRGNGKVIDGVGCSCFSVNGNKLILECRVGSGLVDMQFYVLRALENVLISKDL